MEIKLLHSRTPLHSIPFSVWIVLFLLVGSFALFVGILIPTLTDLQSIPSQLEESQLREAQLLRQITEGAQATRLLRGNGGWDDVTGMFVQESQALEFIVGIEQLAKQHQVVLSLDLASTDEETAAATPKKRDIQMTAQGEWNQLLQFLNALTHTTPVLVFRTLTFTDATDRSTIPPPPTGSPQSPSAMTLQLLGSTYWISP
jgi:hypothetical protein